MIASLSLFLIGMLVSSLDRETTFTCHGLENFEMQVTYHVDAGGGSIRSKRGSFSVGLSLGPMVAQAIPAERRPGLRWMKVERLGNATIRYGFDVRQKMLEATIVDAPMNHLINVFARPADQKQFVDLIRALAVAPCTVTSRPPGED